MNTTAPKHIGNLKSLFKRLYVRGRAWWKYASGGIWRDTRSLWWVRIVKTLNLSVRSFLDADIQSQACALTYRTLLAIVPALALLFAIGRGFGIQTVFQDELYRMFPAQKEAIEQALLFADSYLSKTGEGLFLGIGIAFLLWTLISLVGNVENTFNKIWDIKSGRSIWRKITDYTAMLLILPVLMICASGLTIFVSNTLQDMFRFSFMTPLISLSLNGASWIFTWLFFTAVFILIPNTKVNKVNALIAGVFAGTGFRVLQWLFVSGQIYVTRYNAIYGSFAFLPLLLIWVQLTWVITLSGSLLCYASQNIFRFSFQSETDGISMSYHRKVTIGVAVAVTRMYTQGKPAPTPLSLSLAYAIPIRLMNRVVDLLVDCGILTRVIINNSKTDGYGLQPAVDPQLLTISHVFDKLNNYGRTGFISNFDKDFAEVNALMDKIDVQVKKTTDTIRLTDIEITAQDLSMSNVTDGVNQNIDADSEQKNTPNNGL